MTIEEIIRIVGLSIPLLISIIGFIISLIKAIKSGKWNKLTEVLKGYIAEAEGFKNYTGAEKKNYVLMCLSDFCKKSNISFDYKKISASIEEILDLTKLVNAREKDKTNLQQIEENKSNNI